MKKIITMVAMILLATSAFAAGYDGHQQTTAGSESVSNAVGGSATTTGNTSGNVTVGCMINCADQTDSTAISAQAARDVAATTQVIKNTPSVSGPPLTTSNDTCMGSTSGSLNIAGIGVGGGSTWTDTNCKMLKNSREMWNMGMKAASLALMCNDELNREALELTGYTCPQTERARKEAADRNEPPIILNSSSTMVMPTGNSVYNGTDPFIRARLGLPALNSAK